MSIKIKIGAEELILWLRKNRKAANIPNDGTHGLGIKIHELIVKELGGEKIAANYASYWANLKIDKNVEKFNLPKTSAQYEIETNQMGKLYDCLSSW